MSPQRTQHLYEVILTWHDKKETLKGWGNSEEEAAADAMNSAGYGGGAVRALRGWEAKRIKDSVSSAVR